MFGFFTEDTIGRHVGTLIHESSDSEKEEGAVALSMATPKDEDCYRVRLGIALHKDGSMRPLEIVAGAVTSMDSEVLQARDITMRRKAETEMLHAREAAEAANATKSQFLAAMSHEFRTPLNAVIGFADVLNEEYFGELNEKQKEYVGLINSCGKHLLELINDILDLSKVEAGRMELVYNLADVPALVDGCMAMIKERCTKHGIALTVKGLDTFQTPKF